jgi:protein-disulfide isomerase
MPDYINKNKTIIITLLLVVVFFAFAVMGKSNSAPESQVDFKQVNIASPLSKGTESAAVSLIQYSDFLCPSCSYFSTQIMPTIDEQYINTDKVKFEFRPMAFIAEGSMIAAEGAYCAIDQSKLWEYHDAIYAYVADSVFNKKLDPKTDIILTSGIVKQNAANVGLDKQSFDDCLDSGKHNKDVVSATNTANKNGINSTPYILVNGQRYQGDMSLTSIEALIKSQL